MYYPGLNQNKVFIMELKNMSLTFYKLAMVPIMKVFKWIVIQHFGGSFSFCGIWISSLRVVWGLRDI